MSTPFRGEAMTHPSSSQNNNRSIKFILYVRLMSRKIIKLYNSHSRLLLFTNGSNNKPIDNYLYSMFRYISEIFSFDILYNAKFMLYSRFPRFNFLHMYYVHFYSSFSYNLRVLWLFMRAIWPENSWNFEKLWSIKYWLLSSSKQSS